MKAKTIFIMLLLLFCSRLTYAQKVLRPVKIGEKIPDVELKMLNYKTPTVKLSDFRGKWLILDFWSTWCSVCLAELPKLEVLQKEFPDSIVILPVGFDYHEPGAIKRYVESKIKSPQGFDLPSAVQDKDDSSMIKLFPFNGLPQEVWISPQGKLIAITTQLSVTKNNLEKIMDGKQVFLPPELTDLSFDISKPLLVDHNGGNENNFSYREILTRYKPDLHQDEYVTRDSSGVKITFINETIINMIKSDLGNCYPDSSFGKEVSYDPLDKRVAIEGSCKNKLLNWPHNDYSDISMYNFERKNLYCHEIILPPDYSLQQAYQKMLSDLEFLFHLNVSVKKREVNCLVLEKIPGVKGVKNLKILNTKTSPEYLTEFINTQLDLPYTIDDVSNADSVYLDHVHLNNNMTLPELQTELKECGLRLRPARETLDMLVIKCN